MDRFWNLEDGSLLSWNQNNICNEQSELYGQNRFNVLFFLICEKLTIDNVVVGEGG